MLLSIIVPAYNVEKYIEKCIESLINQENIDYEIIIVNDGATDGTPQKINKLKQKYPSNIVVINQVNNGLGGARNTGIKAAKGKYITFVDSDDYLVKNTFGNLFNIVEDEEFDMLCFKHIEFLETDNIDENALSKKYDNKKEILNNLQIHKKFFNSEITSYAWDKIYNANIFKENNIVFSEKTYYEDLRVVYESISISKKVINVNYCGYLYLQRDNSITKTFTEKHLNDFVSEYKVLLEKIPSNIKIECLVEIDTYKILKRNSIVRNIIGLDNDKYRIDDIIDVNISKIKVIKNPYLNINEKIIALIGDNKNIFKIMKKINNIIK